MESDTHRDTVGSCLRAARLGKGLSIEDISRITRITTDILAAMEADDVPRLLPKTYMKSFIRMYTKVVEMDPRGVIRLYLADLDRREKEYQAWRKQQEALSTLRNVLITVGLITSFFLLIRYTDIVPQPGLSELEPFPALRPFILDQDAMPDPSISPPPGKPLVLAAVAVEATWLKVMVDGKTVRFYEMKPEERLVLEGMRNFNLMVGSATGLRVSLDGNPVELSGSTGQIVSLRIP
ncbi:DUF4115 domain-containing protein [Desulfosarcina sp. OttesenSCG-928-A07]|nr:DUF4115 domain-containing protein [Desulfosarcina sp. OttesenSCG-928-G17]MDL2329777.1 DUF4115 domain-containing protein [Desulfosarcina sp. OttesenSCG-928-A07]